MANQTVLIVFASDPLKACHAVQAGIRPIQAAALRGHTHSVVLLLAAGAEIEDRLEVRFLASFHPVIVSHLLQLTRLSHAPRMPFQYPVAHF